MFGFFFLHIEGIFIFLQLRALWHKCSVNSELQTTPCLLAFHSWKKCSDMSTPRMNTKKKYISPFGLLYQLCRFLDIVFLRSLFYRAKEPHMFWKAFRMSPAEGGLSIPGPVRFEGSH